MVRSCMKPMYSHVAGSTSLFSAVFNKNNLTLHFLPLAEDNVHCLFFNDTEESEIVHEFSNSCFSSLSNYTHLGWYLLGHQ